MQKTCSMDVYSYGMIGYEIITRKVVYSGNQVPHDALIDLIKTKGQKPDPSCIDEVANNLEKNSSDSTVLDELNKIVNQCWQTKAEDRPKISDVEKRLNELATKQQIYSKKTNSKIEQLISRRKLNTPLPKCQKSKTSVRKWAALLVAITAIVLAIIYDIANRQLNTKNAAIVFLGLDPKSLTKYEWEHGSKPNNVTTYLPFPMAFQSDDSVPDFVKVNDLVFVTSFSITKNALKVNLSESPLKWKEIKWKNEYKGRKYIAYKDSIFAAGMNFDHMNSESMNHDNVIKSMKQSLIQSMNQNLIESINQTVLNAYLDLLPYRQAYLYNTTTYKWTRLPNMNQPRVGHALVVFKGLICAVGGSPVLRLSTECFNFSTNQWTFLPSMNTERQYAAAAELNDELYVMGGTIVHSDDHSPKFDIGIYPNLEHDSVEKYNPDKNEWTNVDSLLEKRMCHGAGVFNGKIYVLGGYSDIIEVYDPLVKTWNELDVLPNHRIRFSRFIACSETDGK